MNKIGIQNRFPIQPTANIRKGSIIYRYAITSTILDSFK